jgi:hypothetical protein
MGTENCPAFDARPKLVAPVTAVLVVLCLALGHSAVEAQVINFDMPGGVGGVNYSGQAAAADSGTYWNPIAYQGTKTGAFLSDGVTSSPITLTDTSPSKYDPGQGAQGTPAGLEAPFALESDISVVMETMSNVPAGSYNLYLYGKNDDVGDADRGTAFTASTSLTAATTQSTVNSVTSAFTQGNDYVEFTNLVVGADGRITFTYTANTAATAHHNPQNEGDFNGLQLVTTTVTNGGTSTNVGTVVNFDVPGGVSDYANYSGQGAYPDTGHDYWNPIVANGATPAGLSSDGATASPIVLTDTCDGVYGGDGQGPQGTPGGLQTPFEYAKPGPKTNTLSNVASGNYTLYLYGINGGSGDSDRGTTFTVWSDLTTPTSLSTLNTPASYTSFIQGNDYVEFENVIVGQGGTITFTWAANAADPSGETGEGDFNGLQLILISTSTNVLPTAPFINMQPVSVSLSAGSSTELTTVVTGGMPLFYQWQKGTNGVYVNSVDTGDVSGSMTNVLSFSAVTASDAADYRLIVTNAAGAVTSQVATVTVIVTPAITIQPASVSLAVGSPTLLAAGVSGALPLSYQWQKGTNGVYVNSVDTGDVSGSTTSALVFSALTASDAADYRLLVSNDYGSATSQVATVTVTEPSGYNPQRTGLSYIYPATYSDWADAFLAGNGQMGIMVFGNPLQDTIIYNDRRFNMAASTSAPFRTFDQLSDSTLSTIRNDCASGDFSAADNLAATAPNWQNGGEGNRHPGFEMLISIPQNGTVNNYSRVCNFETGEISVNWSDNLGTWVRKAFVSRQDNVIVQYLPAPSGGTITCSLQLTTDPGMNFASYPGMVFTPIVSANYLDLRVNYPPSSDDAGYEGLVRVVVSGGSESVSGSILNISNANSVLLLTRTAKYYTNCEAQWDQQLLQAQLADISTNYDTLLNGQIATHQAIYDRVQLNFNASAADRALPNEELLDLQSNSPTAINALWERIFDAGRYYFLSSSSSNTPPDLFGIWTGDADAAFGGFYNTDANLNVQVAGGNIGDMPEAMAGYFQINTDWQPGEETSASHLLGCRGMVGVGNTPGTNGLISALSTYYPYQYATGEEGWLLYPLWEHYLITGDTNFLQNSLYPLLLDMGYFYQDFLSLTDTNGNYIFAGSVSPENQPSNLAVSLLNDSTFDIAGAKFALTALIQTCNTLGLQQGAGGGVATWTALLNKLPPYLIGEPNNPDGALAEWSWPGLDDNYDHRHSSHLITVWPLREITPETTPALFNAASITLAKKDAYDYENAGHGWVHSALIAAGLKNATAVNHKILYLLQNGFYFGSLASSHYNANSVFCTDTCHAVPGIMMEMLVSSSPGVVELLPALPQTLNKGAISEMKCRNQVTVQNLCWDLGANTISCALQSDIDQSITLIERSGINTISATTPVSLSPLGQIARVISLPAGVPVSVSIGLGRINLALNRPVTVSSVAGNNPGANAVDGNPGTWWASAGTENEWIYVDLGSVMALNGVQLTWGPAYGQSYNIQVSGDAVNWTNVYETPTGQGGVDRITFAANGRYVRMLGVQSGSAFGYSLAEFAVYGRALSATAPPLLRSAWSNGALNLLWPASAPFFYLESATNLMPPVDWTQVTNPVSILGPNNTVVVTPSQGNLFFRLLQP